MKMTAETLGDQRNLCPGQSYLERLGIVYTDEIRLTIVEELHMREMGPRQFFETIGGTSYDSIRRHFLKLVESGWLRKVRTVATGRGRPEALYRSTEQAVIDTETWRTIPVSIRDAFTVMLLEDMGSRLGDALEGGTAEARADRVAAFTILEIDELAWCRAHDAIVRCFHTLEQEQIDAKIRLETSQERPLLVTVNLGAFEAPGPQVPARLALPKVAKRYPPTRWPDRIGQVFSDRLDLAIVEELNHTAMTPAQLHAKLGGTSPTGFLRRCKRLADLGWVTIVKTRTGGALRGAKVYEFRAASPSVSEEDIVERIPPALQEGRAWDAFERFLATSVKAVDAGAFNNRSNRHLTSSSLLVDEIGWTQVTRALRSFEEKLLGLEVDLAKRCRGEGARFPAAFLLSSFESPIREMRQ
jgi:DNA-binding PadR family transcriptional regulator/DNA-binding Lrp family transcriptional regulator